jgi:hypothetical protein
MTLMLVPSDAIASLGAVATLGGGLQAGRDAIASQPEPGAAR